MRTHQNNIIEYYDTCESDYRIFWDLDHSLAMHAGFWDETTRTLRDALEKENEVVAELAKIKSSDRVLDAGCGVGGSAVFLARHYGCHVTGISLSSKQVETAKGNTQKVEPCPEFHVMDFSKTTFPNESFDVVWGIESICHAEDKSAFFREAYRLLKPGGRLVVADGFASKSSYTPKEQKKMRFWLSGWGGNLLETSGVFARQLGECNFQNIAFQDTTAYVMPSSRRLFFYSLPAFVLSKLGQCFGLRTKQQTENIRAAYHQYRTIRKGLWHYGMFYAEKKK